MRAIQLNDELCMVLTTLSESPTPIGAWNLRRVFEEHGIHISEATCGRLLRILEEAGYAKPDGQRGRVITKKGISALEEWQRKQVRDRTQKAFLQSLEIRHPKELVDVLVARRGIESEAAALAATSAGEDDFTRMKEAIREQEKVLAAGGSATQQNAEFHMALAAASKNAVLLSALEVIYRHPQVMRALEYIRTSVGSRMVEEHSAILHKVETGDSDGARAAMAEHLNNLIRDVETYRREQIGKGSEQF